MDATARVWAVLRLGLLGVGVLLVAGAWVARLEAGAPLRAPSTDVFGWTAPGAFGAAAFWLLVAVIVVLAVEPEPWWATRCSWLWLVLAWPPVVGVALLLLSGPTPGVQPPRYPDRRLTGGWAFLLAAAVAVR